MHAYACIPPHGLKRSQEFCFGRMSARKKNTRDMDHPRRLNFIICMNRYKRSDVQNLFKNGEHQRSVWEGRQSVNVASSDVSPFRSIFEAKENYSLMVYCFIGSLETRTSIVLLKTHFN